MTDGKRQVDEPARRRVSDEAVAAAILDLARAKGREGSIGPNDAARTLAPEQWQSLLPRVRQAAIGLAKEGRLEILRKGKPADPAAFKGVYRLRIGPETPAGEGG
jgi:hypothetical protein